MPPRAPVADLPDGLRRALRALPGAAVRSEVRLAEMPAPRRLAPYGVALTGEIGADEDELASGRLVVLVDPAGQQAWGGITRCVAYVRARLEPEMAGDPLLPAVGWSWLLDALAGRAVGYAGAGGTVTRVSSEHFGALANDEPGNGEVELRASWTALPDTQTGWDLTAHLAAWVDVLCQAAGLPPVPPGVVAIPSPTRPSTGGPSTTGPSRGEAPTAGPSMAGPSAIGPPATVRRRPSRRPHR